MQDREVFARDSKTVEGKDGPRTVETLFITEAAKKRWSAFNPRGFTPAVALNAVLMARGGNYLEAVATSVSVPRTTLKRWLALDDNADHWEGKKEKDGGLIHDTEELRAFRKEFYTAEGQVECEATSSILRLGHAGDGRLLMQFLERRHPERWRQRTTSILENPDGTPVTPPRLEVTLFEGSDSTTATEPKPD
jgi:hypothetical protein